LQYALETIVSGKNKKLNKYLGPRKVSEDGKRNSDSRINMGTRYGTEGEDNNNYGRAGCGGVLAKTHLASYQLHAPFYPTYAEY